MPVDDMEGPGGTRAFAARWTICADLVAQTAVHLGNGEEGAFVDLALARHRASGRPLLTGASLAGGLRDHLCDLLLGDLKPEPRIQRPSEPGVQPPKAGDREIPPHAVIAELFGAPGQDPAGGQGALIAFDAQAGEAAPEVRDGVTIEPKTGTARKHLKYDLEVWPPGTTFGIRLDLLVTRPSKAREPVLLAALALALEGFGSGAIRLGARGRRGLGRCRLGNLRVQRFPLDDPRGWERWLSTWRDEPRPGDGAAPRGSSPLEALGQAWPDGAIASEHRRLGAAAASEELTLTVPLRFAGGILIRAPGGSGHDGEVAGKGADVRHLRSGALPVLSGTSVAGALRHRAERVASAVRSAQQDAPAWVEELFGTPPRERGEAAAGLRASRLTVEEVPLQGGSDLQVTRIRIDRFTQAPVAGALLQEEPWYRAHATLELRLRLPDEPPAADALSGLLLLVVKDLLLGDVPLGGTTGVGRGAVLPAGSVTVERAGSTWGFTPGEPPDDATRVVAEGWVQAFAAHPARSGQATARR